MHCSLAKTKCSKEDANFSCIGLRGLARQSIVFLDRVSPQFLQILSIFSVTLSTFSFLPSQKKYLPDHHFAVELDSSVLTPPNDVGQPNSFYISKQSPHADKTKGWSEWEKDVVQTTGGVVFKITSNHAAQSTLSIELGQKRKHMSTFALKQ